MMTPELFLSLILNIALLSWVVSQLVLSAKRTGDARRLLSWIQEHHKDESRAWRDERQKLMDRVQSHSTEDFALMRNIAMAEDAAETEEPEPMPEWRVLASKHFEFAEVADLITIDPGDDERPSEAWIPTGVDRGYSMPIAEFFQKIGYSARN